MSNPITSEFIAACHSELLSSDPTIVNAQVVVQDINGCVVSTVLIEREPEPVWLSKIPSLEWDE